MPPICELFYPLHLPCVCPMPAAQLLETRHMPHTPPARTSPNPTQPQAHVRPSKASGTEWWAAGRALLSPLDFGPSVPAPRGLCSCQLDPSLPGRNHEAGAAFPLLAVRTSNPFLCPAVRLCGRSGGAATHYTSPQLCLMRKGPALAGLTQAASWAQLATQRAGPTLESMKRSRGKASDEDALGASPWPLLPGNACSPSSWVLALGPHTGLASPDTAFACRLCRPCPA